MAATKPATKKRATKKAEPKAKGGEQLKADRGYKPHLRISPPEPLTHHELILDFLDGEPNADFVVRIGGPIAQPYYATLKTDPFGNAQLIWRTAQAGDYDVKVETVGKQTGWEGEFTVAEQAGLHPSQRAEAAEPEKRGAPRKRGAKAKAKVAEKDQTGSVMSVEPPSLMEPENKDTLSQEAQVARGMEDPEVLGEVDEQHLDAAGESEEPVENATIGADGETAQAPADQKGGEDERDVRPPDEVHPAKDEESDRG